MSKLNKADRGAFLGFTNFLRSALELYQSQGKPNLQRALLSHRTTPDTQSPSILKRQIAMVGKSSRFNKTARPSLLEL